MATKMEIHAAYVEELNKVAGFDPQIPTDFDSVKELKKRVKKEMAKYGGQLFVFDEEKLSEELWEFLTDDLDIEPRPKKEWASFVAALEKEAVKRANEDKGDEDEDASPDNEDEENEDESETKSKTSTGKEKDMATDKGKGKTEKKEKEKTTTSKKPAQKTSSGGIAGGVRNLLESGEKMDSKAIAKKLGTSPAMVTNVISKLKNPKYAGGSPLNIVKDDKGRFHLATEDEGKKKSKKKSK